MQRAKSRQVFSKAHRHLCGAVRCACTACLVQMTNTKNYSPVVMQPKTSQQQEVYTRTASGDALIHKFCWGRGFTSACRGFKRDLTKSRLVAHRSTIRGQKDQRNSRFLDLRSEPNSTLANGNKLPNVHKSWVWIGSPVHESWVWPGPSVNSPEYA